MPRRCHQQEPNHCNVKHFDSISVRGAACLTGPVTSIQNLAMPPRYLRVELLANQGIPNGYSFTPVQFASIVANTLTLASFNTSSFKFITVEAGVYGLTAAISWQDNATNTREIVLEVYDSTNTLDYVVASTNPVFGTVDSSSVSASLFLPAGYSVRVTTRHNAGVTVDALLSASTFFEVTRSF